MKMQPSFLVAAVLAALAPLTSAPAQADSQVFRCVQDDGRILYTDTPCRNGAVVDLHPGKADPAAAQRLADARAELDAGMAQRRAADARAAAQAAAYLPAGNAVAQAPPQYDEPVYGLYGGYGYGYVNPRPPVRPRPPRPPAKVGSLTGDIAPYVNGGRGGSAPR